MLSSAILFSVALLKPPLGIHAHNDYEKARPFWAAYEAGAASIEADIFPIGGELRLGHTRNETRPGFTLESTYLQPLRDLSRSGKLRPVWLLVDVKEHGEECYLLLSRLLGKYLTLLSTPQRPNGRPGRAGKVKVIVSGNRPLDLFRSDPYPAMWIDGRLADRSVLSRAEIERLSPLLSESFLSVKDPAEFVRQGAEYAQVTRLWGTPDSPMAWKQFADLGIGLINTDHPSEAVKALPNSEAVRNYSSRP